MWHKNSRRKYLAIRTLAQHLLAIFCMGHGSLIRNKKKLGEAVDSLQIYRLL
jgi:hypothetical protein